MPSEEEVGLGEQPEEVGENPEEETALYQREEFPTGIENQVKWYLLRGKTDKELLGQEYNDGKGYNKGTIRIAKRALVKTGLLKEEPRPPEKPRKTGRALIEHEAPVNTQVFSKGSPPEALINAMVVPNVDGELVGFDKGMKFGANLVVLGVRVAQELSAIGIQQARPVIDMAKSMREGEAMAAKGAAMDAAAMAAGQVERNIAPYLAAMGKASEGVNPMQAMMAKMFEPLMMNIVSKFVPGMQAPSAQGWAKRSE